MMARPPRIAKCLLTFFTFHKRHDGCQNRYIATLFSVVAPSGARVTCAAFEVDTGLELRLDNGDDTMRSELFRGVDRYEQTAEAADTLRRALLEIGFTEIDIP